MTAGTRSNAKPLPVPSDPTAPGDTSSSPGKLDFIQLSLTSNEPIAEEPAKASAGPKAKEPKAKGREKGKRGGAKGKGKELVATDTLQSIPDSVIVTDPSPMNEVRSSTVNFTVPIIVPAPRDPYEVTTSLGLTSATDNKTNLEHHTRSAQNDVRLGEYIVNLMKVTREIQAANPAGLSARMDNLENVTITSITERVQALEDDQAEATSTVDVDALRRELGGLSEAVTSLRNQCMMDRATTDSTIGILRGQVDNLANTMTGDRVRATGSSHDPSPAGPAPMSPGSTPFIQGSSTLPIRNTAQHANTFHPYPQPNGTTPSHARTCVIYGPHPGLILDTIQDPTYRVRGFVNDLRISGTRANQVVTARRVTDMPDTLRIVFATPASASAFVTRILASRPVPSASASLE